MNAARSDAHVTSKLDTFAVSAYHYKSKNKRYLGCASNMCGHTGSPFVLPTMITGRTSIDCAQVHGPEVLPVPTTVFPGDAS